MRISTSSYINLKTFVGTRPAELLYRYFIVINNYIYQGDNITSKESSKFLSTVRLSDSYMTMDF